MFSQHVTLSTCSD